MRRISTIWVLVSLILPCCVNPENMCACFLVLVNLALAVRSARKHNPSMFV